MVCLRSGLIYPVRIGVAAPTALIGAYRVLSLGLPRWDHCAGRGASPGCPAQTADAAAAPAADAVRNARREQAGSPAARRLPRQLDHTNRVPR